jgi:HSP20 family protein
MYLTTFDPFGRDLYRQFDRLARRTAFGPVAMPLDVVRHDGDVTLRFDVPGSDPDSIEVTVDRGVLTVSVKRQEERTENDKFFVRERSFGTFTRRLRLSENMNADAVEASYTNGVLEVRIPVLEQAKPRKVEVRKGESAEQVTPAEQAEEIAA